MAENELKDEKKRGFNAKIASIQYRKDSHLTVTPGDQELLRQYTKKMRQTPVVGSDIVADESSETAKNNPTQANEEKAVEENPTVKDAFSEAVSDNDAGFMEADLVDKGASKAIELVTQESDTSWQHEPRYKQFLDSGEISREWISVKGDDDPDHRNDSKYKDQLELKKHFDELLEKEVDPSIPIEGQVVGGVEAPTENQNILEDLKKIGEKMTPAERDVLAEKLRLQGIDLPKSLFEATPNGASEREGLLQAVEIVTGVRPVRTGNRDDVYYGWRDKEQAEDYLKNLGVKFDDGSPNSPDPEPVPTKDGSARAEGDDNSEERDTSMPFKEKLAVIDDIPDSRDKLDEINDIRRELRKKRPLGWQDMLQELREKQDEVESHNSAVNMDEVNRQFDFVQNSANFLGDLKQRMNVAKRWLERYKGKNGVSQEMVDAVEKIKNGDEIKFIRNEAEEVDEEDQIREFCFQQIFEVDEKDQARGSQQIYSLLTQANGFLRTGLFKSPSEADLLAKRTKEIVDDLGLDNWIAVRDNVKEWGSLKGLEEVTPRSLSTNLFLPVYAETWFAGVYKEGTFIKPREIMLPGEKVPVDLQKEVSLAMKKMRNYFEGSWKPNIDDPEQPGSIIGKDDQEPVEYWGYVGADVAQKADLYKSIGINKYVGEVAFSMLLSHNMLTDTSKYDIFLQMVDTAKKRVNSYGVSEERDPLVRMMVQRILSNGGVSFTDKARIEKEIPQGDDHKNRVKDRVTELKKEMERRVATFLPRHMIATGLTRGRSALDNNSWLEWRVNDDTYLSSQKEREKSQGAQNPDKIATDPIARREMMSNALDVLTVLKDVTKPESDIDKLEILKGKVMKWTLGDLATAGWTREIDGKNLVHKEFCLEDASGSAVDTDPARLASRLMLIASEMFMFSHSIPDAENNKPWDPSVFADKAKEVLAIETQSHKGTYIGLSSDPEINKQEKLQFISYVDRLWKDMMDVVNSTSVTKQTVNVLLSSLIGNSTTVKFPTWFNRGVPPSPEKVKEWMNFVGSSAWPDVKKNIRI